MDVEIDGIHHSLTKKKRFCAARDEYLKEQHDVRVVRLDVIAMSRLTRDEKIAVIADKLKQEMGKSVVSVQ